MNDGIKELIGKIYLDSIADVFVNKPKQEKWMDETEDEFAKDWIIKLQKENDELKEDKERLYKQIRGLNSDLGRTLWNPQG